MPRRRTAGIAIVGLGLIGLAAAQTPVATRRTPQFENESVRVWKSVIVPGQPLSMHRHEAGRVIVALKGGTLEVVEESGASRPMTWETGKAYWLPADPPGTRHGDRNPGPEPIEVMVVELVPPGR